MIFRMTLIERKDENMFASKVEADSLTEAIYQALDTHGFFDDLDTEMVVDIYHFSDISELMEEQLVLIGGRRAIIRNIDIAKGRIQLAGPDGGIIELNRSDFEENAARKVI